jgi:hypothetical protein
MPSALLIPLSLFALPFHPVFAAQRPGLFRAVGVTTEGENPAIIKVDTTEDGKNCFGRSAKTPHHD